MLFTLEGTGKKISCNHLKKSMGDVQVLSHCSLLRNPWP